MWSYSSVSTTNLVTFGASLNSRGYESWAQRRMREQDERALRAMESFRDALAASDVLRASFDMAKPPMWWLRGDQLVPQIAGGGVSLRPRTIAGERSSVRARRWKRWGKHAEASGLVPRNAG